MTQSPQPDHPNEYWDESDIPKIISMLEDIVIKNNWDANVGTGPGDYAFGDVRIPSRYVQGFVEYLRPRNSHIPEQILKYPPSTGDMMEDAYNRGKIDGTREATYTAKPIVRKLRNALIVAANNAHERKAIVNEVKPERMFYNEMQFRSLVELALEVSKEFKADYESTDPLKWNRESIQTLQEMNRNDR